MHALWQDAVLGNRTGHWIYVALHLRFRVMVYGWDDFDVPGSRFTNQAVFVVTVPEPEEGDRITDAQVAEAAAAARGESDVRITAFRATYGRGASDSAIGLLVDFAIGFAPSVVAAIWMRIRHRRPIMSVGALRYLCMADLAQRLGLDSLDDVVEVVACDTAGARPPELNPVDIEPVLVVSPTERIPEAGCISSLHAATSSASTKVNQ